MNAQAIIAAALLRSNQNEATDLAEQATELVAVLNRVLAGVYAVAARVSPEWVSEAIVVPEVNGTWARPARAESVWRIEDAQRREVIVVGVDDEGADTTRRALTRLGRTYRAVSRPTGTPAGSLTFYCALRPAPLVGLGAALPGSWESAYDDLLILELACYCALKDGRGDELPALRAEQQSWLALFVAFLEHETRAVVRSRALPKAPPLRDLMALYTGRDS